MKELSLLKIVKEMFGTERIEVPATEHDAAYIKLGDRYIVLTCDTVNEISDFPKFMKAKEYGKMAVAVTLSDIAACGAKPVAFLNSISMRSANEKLLREILSGMKEEAMKYDVPVCGGDLDFSPILIITGFAIGEAERVVTRTNAKVGEKVYITSPLGKAELCLEMLKKGFRREDLPYAEKLYTPEAKIKEGMKIARFANAITDISDSLAVSLHLLASESEVKIVLDSGKIDLSHLEDFVDKEKALELFLYGGGDYELLFTAEDSDIGIEIGRVEKGSGVYIDGKKVEFRGYSHAWDSDNP